MKKFLHPKVIVPVVIVGGILFAVGLYVFQPWKLFTTVEVYEAVPTSAEEVLNPVTEEPAVEESTEEASIVEEPAAPAEPVVLEEGTFISHEHSTSGTVKILELPDGSRVLRLENLETSDGPQLEVWLTDAPVIDGVDGWGVFDDGKYVSLGALKGNVGDQNYMIPDDVNLDDFSSVSIWCARFNVSFGAAELNS
ncbi:MAG: hypothetical protein RJB01_796 [Actinomycetota bacterium]|jgi:hypothetical protein